VRVIRCCASGGLDSLALCDEPRPRPPEPGELTVRIEASSLNFHEYAVVAGMVGPREGLVPMADAAGTVEAVGPGVTDFSPGDAVVSVFFPEWRDGRATGHGFDTVPGDGVDGYARAHVTVPASRFTRAPRGWTAQESATLPTAGLTAWRSVAMERPVGEGDTVLVLGTGAVSLFAMQIALWRGARVFALSSDPAKRDRLLGMGAEAVGDYRADPDWGRTVRSWTQGRGVDLVVDVAGGPGLAQSVEACAVGGDVHLIGVLDGFSGDIPLTGIINRQVRVSGLTVGSARAQEDMIAALEDSPIRPIIDTDFALDDIAEAFAHLASGRHFGKITLTIGA